jgi:hypothetical protein
MNQKVRVGDVFLIPIDDTRCGVGQIAGDWKGELYIVVYNGTWATVAVDIEKATSAEIIFAALSLDAKIYHGDWRIVGNIKTNLDQIPQPVFKVNQSGKVFLESRDRSRTRQASPSEAEVLRYRTVVAPIRLEKALKTQHGIGDWLPEYESLRADYAFESSRILAD